MAKVSIIRSPSLFAAGALTLSATPPIGIAYLAASVAAAGHEVEVVDAIGEAIEQVHYFGVRNLYVNGLTLDEVLGRVPADTQFICVSFPFSHEWPLAKKICFALKERFPSAVIIGGGEHITAMPEFSIKNCAALDYAVLGEGEETIIELIEALSQRELVHDIAGIAFRMEGQVVLSPRRERIKNIDQITRPAWDLIPLETYLAGGYSLDRKSVV